MGANITQQLHTKLSDALLANNTGPINSCWEAFPGALTNLHIKIIPTMLAAAVAKCNKF